MRSAPCGFEYGLKKTRRNYTATLYYNDGSETKAKWRVLDIGNERKAKNVILFIGDGMTSAFLPYIACSELIVHRCHDLCRSLARAQEHQW